MNIPGFTAEASLTGTNTTYRRQESLHRVDHHAYPAQLAANLLRNRDYLTSVYSGWLFMEPNCHKICLPSWGGHCRWICY